MKIKLQDYSLISNHLLELLLDRVGSHLSKDDLEIIPSEKLAEHSLEYGAESLYHTIDPNTGIAKGFKELKEKYLKSEIEI